MASVKDYKKRLVHLLRVVKFPKQDLLGLPKNVLRFCLMPAAKRRSSRPIHWQCDSMKSNFSLFRFHYKSSNTISYRLQWRPIYRLPYAKPGQTHSQQSNNIWCMFTGDGKAIYCHISIFPEHDINISQWKSLPYFVWAQSILHSIYLNCGSLFLGKYYCRSLAVC